MRHTYANSPEYVSESGFEMRARFIEVTEKGEDAAIGGGAVGRVVHVLHHRNQALKCLSSGDQVHGLS